MATLFTGTENDIAKTTIMMEDGKEMERNTKVVKECAEVTWLTIIFIHILTRASGESEITASYACDIKNYKIYY